MAAPPTAAAWSSSDEAMLHMLADRGFSITKNAPAGYPGSAPPGYGPPPGYYGPPPGYYGPPPGYYGPPPGYGAPPDYGTPSLPTNLAAPQPPQMPSWRGAEAQPPPASSVGGDGLGASWRGESRSPPASSGGRNDPSAGQSGEPGSARSPGGSGMQRTLWLLEGQSQARGLTLTLTLTLT